MILYFTLNGPRAAAGRYGSGQAAVMAYAGGSR